MTRRKIVTVPVESEKQTAEVWQSRSSKGQSVFFNEYQETLDAKSMASSIVLDEASEVGLPEYMVKELTQLLGMLNPEIEFLLADGLIGYFHDGKREYTGLSMLDEMLDPLFNKMERYLFPFAYNKD